MAAAENPRKKQTLAENALPVLKLLSTYQSNGPLEDCNTTDPAIHVVNVGVQAIVRFQAFTRPLCPVYTLRTIVSSSQSKSLAARD